MPGGTNFCNPEALTAFADRAEELSESLDGHISRVEGARVGREAFGRMPFIGSRIHTAYDEHVDGTEEGMEQARDALLGASGAAGTSAAEWLIAEQENIEAAANVGEPG
ncbi:hypothetical protein [Nocardioides sp. AE5]|uniref:hypothetical protein n=1 Tax=Nocardioides sp. AE5 TaxID=2962573 RepID=UPI0028824270|nr:hypothetical protein [Nocardioides sp. AE5]MDT0202223.1 hypothetical protein [Nocardioides sp. AE5]